MYILLIILVASYLIPAMQVLHYEKLIYLSVLILNIEL